MRGTNCSHRSTRPPDQPWLLRKKKPRRVAVGRLRGGQEPTPRGELANSSLRAPNPRVKGPLVTVPEVRRTPRHQRRRGPSSAEALQIIWVSHEYHSGESCPDGFLGLSDAECGTCFDCGCVRDPRRMAGVLMRLPVS